LVAVADDEERPLPFGIVLGEPVDLVTQRDRHVALERLAQVGSRKLAIDPDEKVANDGMLAVAIAANVERHLPRFFGASAISAPRTRSSSFSAAPSTFGNSSFSPSMACAMASAMTSRANHLLSAGTTYQGASSRLVCWIASS